MERRQSSSILQKMQPAGDGGSVEGRPLSAGADRAGSRRIVPSTPVSLGEGPRSPGAQRGPALGHASRISASARRSKAAGCPSSGR
eukprot:CAMPEP_0177589232 /NCGR_PEP_ID=MMETSP0419_2-20121207/6684_1 /TAXON_ID=582737 /ORGANISM="Tetraselmis sp., Strain GSL018" /LENGTH=85 /DNA_ID=CAMNT_0019079553 /DNA_START=205 /DNA_END=459 /DNA_ORIENTATION=+